MSNDAEYQSLRNELLAISSRQFSMLTFAFTATAALIGLGVNSENNKSLIILTSLIILGFAGVQLVSHAYSTMRIATYIYYFIEPGNEDLNWETICENIAMRSDNTSIISFQNSVGLHMKCF